MKYSEYDMTKQLIRSGTSIAANLRDANEGFSKKDFNSKVYIALKEARETEFWLELLYKTDYLTNKEYISIINDCNELLRIIVAITKNIKSV